jgi:hypothetical protein
LIKTLLLSVLFLCVIKSVSSQGNGIETRLLKKLDSIQNSSTVAKHFAGLYFSVTRRAISFFENSPIQEKTFINRLETRFASLFLLSADAYKNGDTIPTVWKCYFGDSALSPLQYKLLGINAHINGDIWQALTAEFSLQEIKDGRKSYLRFQKALTKEYRLFYEESYRADSKVRLLHRATAGLDKPYGKLILIRWRKRQLKLAILYYSDKEKFNRKLAKLNLKIERINRLILNNL